MTQTALRAAAPNPSDTTNDSIRSVLNAWSGDVIKTQLFEIALEPRDRIIICSTRGFWSVADVDAYHRHLKFVVGSSRSRHGRVRVVSDSRELLVQAPEVASRSVALWQLVDEQQDRLALIVSSSLRKLQIRRAIPGQHCQIFFSADDARSWLTS